MTLLKRIALLSLTGSLALGSTARAGTLPDRWNMPHAGNPILPGYYADPTVLSHAGKFYIYVTVEPWGGDTLGCWESSDFKQWTFRELNWPTKQACTSPTSKGAMVWAPSVVRKKPTCRRRARPPARPP